MTAVDTREDLVPLRTDFDLAWRGYHPRQVQHYVRAVETDFRLLAADRDAAVARAEDLARQLEAARSEIRELSDRLDRVCRTPVEPDALTGRLRRMAELAHEEAAEITRRAEIAAERSWAAANQAATRLRERHERLISELDTRRREMEAEHRDLMRRAHEDITAATRQAEQRRRQLDDQAAELRQQVEDDFRLAMAARRAEATQAMAQREAAAKVRADQLVREATDQADRILVEAHQQLDVLRGHRARIAARLRNARQLLSAVNPLLDPLAEETTQFTDNP